MLLVVVKRQQTIRMHHTRIQCCLKKLPALVQGMLPQLLLVCRELGGTAVSLTNAGTGLMLSTLLPGTAQSEQLSDEAEPSLKNNEDCFDCITVRVVVEKSFRRSCTTVSKQSVTQRQG